MPSDTRPLSLAELLLGELGLRLGVGVPDVLDELELLGVLGVLDVWPDVVRLGLGVLPELGADRVSPGVVRDGLDGLDGLDEPDELEEPDVLGADRSGLEPLVP